MMTSKNQSSTARFCPGSGFAGMLPWVGIFCVVLALDGYVTAKDALRLTPSAPQRVAGRSSNALPDAKLAEIPALALSELPTGPDGQRVVAVVNGTSITERRFLAELALAVEQQKFSQIPSPTNKREAEGLRAALAQPVIDQLIANVIIRDYARKSGMRVDDRDIDRAITQTNARLPAGRKLQDLAISFGLSIEELKETFRTQLLAAKLEDVFAKDLPEPTQAELNEFVRTHPAANAPNEEIRVNHIFLRIGPNDTTATIERLRAQAQRLLQQLREGADFCELALRFSQDRASAINCGDLGYLSRGRMGDEFDRAAFQLVPGQLSEVVRTSKGFHIIYVREKHPTSVRQAFRRYKQRERYLRWFEEQKRSATIQKFL